jgi:5-methyltetrahydrofolate corrinoid/iron sulfur protein methyltransferase
MIIVADNLTITNPTIAAAMDNMDPGPIQDLVRRCEKAGAQAIDLNSGPLNRSPVAHFSFLVETVQAVTSLPLVLDTANPTALTAGLDICRNQAVINGFSLEPAKLADILPLAKNYPADIIGYLLRPNGHVPIEADELMTTAVSLFKTFISEGLAPDRLIIDPVVAPLSWDNGLQHNQALLAVLRSLPDLLGTPVRSIAGLSNLTSGGLPIQRKAALESAYLPMLAAAGLDMALVNVLHAPTMRTALSSRALLGNGIFSWAQIGL